VVPRLGVVVKVTLFTMDIQFSHVRNVNGTTKVASFFVSEKDEVV